MKILIVNRSDIQGGAARAAYRLHLSLLANNVDSQMLVQNKYSDDFTVTGPMKKLEKIISILRPKISILPINFYKRRTKTPFSPSWLLSNHIIKKINAINPDIVHLHWVCGGMIKIEDIAKIKAPIVWSLHDNWAFTGGCHIRWECEKYKDSCGSCPKLGSNKENDLSRKIYNRKQKTFSKIQNMTIIGLSRWITNSAKESSLFRGKKVLNLPNPIDTDRFKPFSKEKARALWSLPQNKKLVLFGAMNATSDINKGFKELIESLHKVKINDIEFVVFGSSEPKKSQKFGFKTHYLGHLHDDVSLVTLYNAVDVMIVPSLEENLSNTIMENLACGTPVVGFDIGGNSDMIEHKKTGYLARAFDTSDLAYGIEWSLNAKKHEILSQNARDKVLREFDSNVVAKKYIKLYEEVLND